MDDVMTRTERERPFPKEEYKNGRLKRLRSRIVKKLMKYELKAIFSVLWMVFAVLAGATVLLIAFCKVNDIKAPQQTQHFDASGLTILLILLYVYSTVAALVAPFIIGESRYQKNFFQSEGYLTFSLPATAEEHIFAKHVSTFIGSLAGGLCYLLSVNLVAGILNFQGFLDTSMSFSSVSNAFYIIEWCILCLEGMLILPCAGGAFVCWTQKFKKKRQIAFRVIIVYVIVMLIPAILSGVDGLDVSYLFTFLGRHGALLIAIVLTAALIALCVWYEIRTFTHKLNLK